jgi:hypothetical protein
MLNHLLYVCILYLYSVCFSVEEETDEKTASIQKKIDLRYNGSFCCAGVGTFCTHGITTFCSGKLVTCSILAGSTYTFGAGE